MESFVFRTNFFILLEARFVRQNTKIVAVRLQTFARRRNGKLHAACLIASGDAHCVRRRVYQLALFRPLSRFLSMLKLRV